MSSVSDIRRALGTLIFLIVGPCLWALHFTLIYGPQSALCGLELGTTDGGHNAIAATTVGVVTIGTLLLGGLSYVFAHACYRLLCGASPPPDQWPYLQFIMRLLTALSLLAIAYAGIAAIFLPACAQHR